MKTAWKIPQPPMEELNYCAKEWLRHDRDGVFFYQLSEPVRDNNGAIDDVVITTVMKPSGGVGAVLAKANEGGKVWLVYPSEHSPRPKTPAAMFKLLGYELLDAPPAEGLLASLSPRWAEVFA